MGLWGVTENPPCLGGSSRGEHGPWGVICRVVPGWGTGSTESDVTSWSAHPCEDVIPCEDVLAAPGKAPFSQLCSLLQLHKPHPAPR